MISINRLGQGSCFSVATNLYFSVSQKKVRSHAGRSLRSETGNNCTMLPQNKLFLSQALTQDNPQGFNH